MDYTTTDSDTVLSPFSSITTCRFCKQPADDGFRSCKRHRDMKRAQYNRMLAKNPERVRFLARAYQAKRREAKAISTRKWRAANPEKGRQYERAWRERNPDKQTSKSKHAGFERHGMTFQTYQDLLKKQGHRCAICGTKEPRGPGRFHIDHDHAIGPKAVRGLLCQRCNIGLGHFRDSWLLLARAIVYLGHTLKPMD